MSAPVEIDTTTGLPKKPKRKRYYRTLQYFACRQGTKWKLAKKTRDFWAAWAECWGEADPITLLGLQPTEVDRGIERYFEHLEIVDLGRSIKRAQEAMGTLRHSAQEEGHLRRQARTNLADWLHGKCDKAMKTGEAWRGKATASLGKTGCVPLEFLSRYTDDYIAAVMVQEGARLLKRHLCGLGDPTSPRVAKILRVARTEMHEQLLDNDEYAPNMWHPFGQRVAAAKRRADSQWHAQLVKWHDHAKAVLAARALLLERCGGDEALCGRILRRQG